jgi:hypothetical protein
MQTGKYKCKYYISFIEAQICCQKYKNRLKVEVKLSGSVLVWHA